MIINSRKETSCLCWPEEFPEVFVPSTELEMACWIVLLELHARKKDLSHRVRNMLYHPGHRWKIRKKELKRCVYSARRNRVSLHALLSFPADGCMNALLRSGTAGGVYLPLSILQP